MMNVIGNVPKKLTAGSIYDLMAIKIIEKPWTKWMQYLVTIWHQQHHLAIETRVRPRYIRD
jgi:hypothetical protein